MPQNYIFAYCLVSGFATEPTEPTQHMKAIVDSIKEKFAILLAGEEEIELRLPFELLPPGIKAGDWLNIIVSPDQEPVSEKDKGKPLIDRVRVSRR